MARHRQSILDDILDIAAALPWWGSLLLAAVGYAFFSWLAAAEIAELSNVRDMGHVLGTTVSRTLASVLQYLIPFAFVGGAALSAVRRAKRHSLLVAAGKDGAGAVISNMTWQQFEMLVGEAFRRRGYRVKESGLGGPDGGIDLTLEKDDQKFLVQCKHWKAQRVGVKPVRELYGVMAAESASGGYMVTSGSYTRDAYAFAADKAIELMDGPALQKLVAEVEHPMPAAKSFRVEASIGSAETETTEPPTCPRCDRAMTKRAVRRGPRMGEEFWGCSAFPKCRGTRDL